eukprot:UN00300
MNDYRVFDYTTQICEDCPGKCQTGTEYECCGNNGGVCETVPRSIWHGNRPMSISSGEQLLNLLTHPAPFQQYRCHRLRYIRRHLLKNLQLHHT